MSFDVYVIVGEGEDDWIDVGNYTANMGGYFRWALSDEGGPCDSDYGRSDSRDAIFGEKPKGGLAGLEGASASGSIFRLDQAIKRTRETNPKELDKFNPSNGWGHWSSASSFLAKIRDTCKEYPNGKIHVSW